MIGDSNDETNFPHKLLLTDWQVSRLHEAFANNSSANTKLSKTQPCKIGQSGGLLNSLLGPLLKTGLYLMKMYYKCFNTIQINIRSISNRCNFQKKILESSMTALIISNEEMDVIMEVVKCLAESSLWIKGVSKTIKTKQRTKRWIFIIIRKSINRIRS